MKIFGFELKKAKERGYQFTDEDREWAVIKRNQNRVIKNTELEIARLNLEARRLEAAAIVKQAREELSGDDGENSVLDQALMNLINPTIAKMTGQDLGDQTVLNSFGGDFPPVTDSALSPAESGGISLSDDKINQLLKHLPSQLKNRIREYDPDTVTRIINKIKAGDE